MKGFLRGTALLLALVMTLGLSGCKRIRVTTYTIALDEEFKLSQRLSDEKTHIYEDKASGAQITVAFKTLDEAKSLCIGDEPTDEDIKTAILNLYTDENSSTKITLEDYELREYSGAGQRTNAVHIFFGKTGVWAMRFSIGNDGYANFKESIPAIISSFSEII